MADKTTGKLKLWIAKITDKISDTINIYLSENFSKIDDEFSSLKDGVDEHKTDDTKHITSTERTIWNNKLDASAYTAADVLAKVKTVDGDGSGLDADLLDGAHAGNGPNNVLKLDSGGFVPLPNIPGTLTGKSADMVDGKHFSDIQNDAQAKADAALNSAKQYTDQEVGEVAQDLAAHKAETASINAIGHVYAAEFTATLSTSWSGSAAPYTQTVTINGITSAHNPIIDVVMSGTYSTDQQRIEQWGYIYRAVTGTNQITFYASEKPTVSLPIQIKVVR